MWVRESCSVWLLGRQGGHKGMLWGKNLGEQLGSKRWDSFLQSAVTGPQGLLPWLQTNRSSLSYWKSLPGCGGPSQKGGKESARKDSVSPLVVEESCSWTD